jgi:hypothetical protein
MAFTVLEKHGEPYAETAKVKMLHDWIQVLGNPDSDRLIAAVGSAWRELYRSCLIYVEEGCRNIPRNL